MSKNLESFIKRLEFNRRANFGTEVLIKENLEILAYTSQACHYGFQYRADSTAWCSSLLEHDTNKEMIDNFWNWVSDKNKSPWKILFLNDDMKLIKDDNNKVKGWVLTNTEKKYDNYFGLVKNFAILCRSVSEKEKRWVFWNHLVSKKKVNPTDAFYMISLCLSIGPENEILTWADERAGGHWALTDLKGTFTGLDWKKFKTGNVDKPIGPIINGYWCSNTQGTNNPIQLSDFSISTKKGKFGNVSSAFTIHDLIDGFYKYQDDRGYLDV